MGRLLSKYFVLIDKMYEMNNQLYNNHKLLFISLSMSKQKNLTKIKKILA